MQSRQCLKGAGAAALCVLHAAQIEARAHGFERDGAVTAGESSQREPWAVSGKRACDSRAGNFAETRLDDANTETRDKSSQTITSEDSGVLPRRITRV